MSRASAQLIVTGTVQGVGYRWFCLQKARQLDIAGWARNNRDGSVELCVEGDRRRIEDFIEQLKIGPYSASVSRVDITWQDPSGNFNSFDVTG
ncbi:MAG: acylphosphatase [Candidatus Zixiibacteriota bacterium]|nr:MAG: acylphosphatase [candidate division Zixibacteria bacterium]